MKPNRVGVSLRSPEYGNRSSFRNVLFSSYLEFRTVGKVQKPSDSKGARLYCLVVRVPGYRSRGPSSIPGATRFSEKQRVWNGVHSASWVQLRSYLKEKVAAPVLKTENTAVRDPSRRPYGTLNPQKLALTSSTSGCGWVGIVRSRTQATEFVFVVCIRGCIVALLLLWR
jgi:hypothetical protein